jgi:hypothetical protein
MGEEAENQVESHPNGANGAPASTGRTGNPEVDILQILCEFDAGLEGLKSIYERRKALETALLEKQSQLGQREKELGSRRAELDLAGADLEKQREEIARAQAETSATREEIEARQQALEERRSAIEAEKSRIDVERASVDDARRQWQEESARREGELQGERERLRQQIEDAERQRQDLDRERAEASAQREVMDSRQRELDSALEVLSQERGAFEQQITELAAREEELNQQRQAVEASQAQVDQRAKELAARGEELAAQGEAIAAQRDALDAQVREIAAREEAIAQRQRELDARAAELEAARAAAEQLAKQCGAERDQAMAELAKAKGELDRTRLELEAKGRGAKAMEPVLEALKKSLVDAEERLSSAIMDSEASKRDGEEMGERLREVVDEYERLWLLELAHGAELTRDLEAARQDVARLDAERANAAEAREQVAVAAAPVASDASTEEIAELEKIIEALKDRLRKEMATREEAQQIAEAAAQDLNAAGEALRAAEQRAEEADKIVVRLREELAKARTRTAGAVDPELGERLSRRRERLRKYRSAVREQASKVRKASEIVKKRYDQAEQVLSHRAELAAIRERVIDAERRSQAGRARTRASQIMFFAVTIIAILGGMSWAISSQVAPAAFMAEATLSADGRGRELLAAELDEWESFHEGVLKDPLFHEAAAERFKRLGLMQLGTPVAVRDVINTSITTDNSRPGELRIRMIGAGAARTERVMEAFTAAFASYSNSLQQKRIDGSATKVLKAAQVSGEPIDNTRTYYALGIMGAGLLVVFAAAYALWSRLARAKSSFEMDQQVASALVGTQWADLIKPDARNGDSAKKDEAIERKAKARVAESKEDAEAARALEEAKANTPSPRGKKADAKVDSKKANGKKAA